MDVRAEQERARPERKLTALNREVTRLIDAYQADVIELTELAERRHRMAEHGRMRRARLQEIEQQRMDRAGELRLLAGVDACCASVQDTMEDPAFEVQRKVVQLVVSDCGGGQSGDHRTRRTDRACSIANGTSDYRKANYNRAVFLFGIKQGKYKGIAMVSPDHLNMRGCRP